MGDLVDLDAFRKQREEEEKAKEEAEAAKDQADYEHMQELLQRIMLNLSDLGLTSGSTIQYTTDDYSYDPYTSFNTYYHEAGYDDDGYYERSSWEFDPNGEYAELSEEDDDDF